MSDDAAWERTPAAEAPAATQRGSDGSIWITRKVGPVEARAGYEYSLPPAVEVGLKGWHRAHAQGAGTGAESSEAISYAPPEVNLKLQNQGVERFIRDLYLQKRPDVEIYLTTVTRRHPGTLRLANIEYKLEAELAGRRTRLWEAELIVANCRDQPHVAFNGDDYSMAEGKAEPFLRPIDQRKR